MCRHVYTHHLCSHNSVRQLQCYLTPSIFGTLFCDEYQTVTVSSGQFCSPDGTYCSETMLGRRIDNDYHLLRLCQADLGEVNRNIRDAASYTVKHMGAPGHLTAQESLLHEAPLSLQQYNRQRASVDINMQKFMSDIRSSKIVLALQGLASQDVLAPSPLAQKPSPIVKQTQTSRTSFSDISPERRWSADRSFTSNFSPSKGPHIPTPERRPPLVKERSNLTATSLSGSVAVKHSSQRSKSRRESASAKSDYANSASKSAVRRSDRLSG